ncbi:MAG: hypothetical protein EXR77_01800 [Myxococcales bacterium]|nr:hypothetical protein [Myxococcales bacterium]
MPELLPSEANPPDGLDEPSDPGRPIVADSAARAAVEAFANVALAPVQEIRHSPWLLRSAMLLATGAGPLVGAAAWSSGQPDWVAYLIGGVSTTILVGNFMRWRRRWGWFRRGLHMAAALGVLATWSALLLDRAWAPTPDAAIAQFVAASSLFWLPFSANAGAAVLLVAHYITATRTDRRFVAAGN